jgi:hypothetical protein
MGGNEEMIARELHRPHAQLARVRSLAMALDALQDLLDEGIALVMTGDDPPSIAELADAIGRSKSTAFQRWERIRRSLEHAEEDQDPTSPP